MLKPLDIFLYTDASRVGDKCCSSAMVLTKNTFLGFVSREVQTDKTSKAEIISVQQGLDYIDKLDLNINKIIIYSDFRRISQVFNKYKYEGYSLAKRDKAWDRIFELSSKYNIQVHYFARAKLKPNTVMACDIYSRKSLQV